MKDRMLLLSMLIACCIHGAVLCLNLGVSRPSIASQASAIEVALVGPPQSAAPAAEPEAKKAPGQPSEETPPARIEPEPVIRPRIEPVPIPELEPAPEPEPTPVTVPAVPEPAFVQETAVEEPVIEKEIFPAPETAAAEAAGNLAEGEMVDLVGRKFLTPAAEGDEAVKGVSGDEAESSGQTESLTTSFDRMPSYSYNPKPSYPRAARRGGQEGTALLRVEVLSSGRVGRIRLERSSGHELLDDAAIKAVGKWRFVPAKKGRNPVQAWVRIPVEFSLKD